MVRVLRPYVMYISPVLFLCKAIFRVIFNIFSRYRVFLTPIQADKYPVNHQVFNFPCGHLRLNFLVITLSPSLHVRQNYHHRQVVLLTGAVGQHIALALF